MMIHLFRNFGYLCHECERLLKVHKVISLHDGIPSIRILCNKYLMQSRDGLVFLFTVHMVLLHEFSYSARTSSHWKGLPLKSDDVLRLVIALILASPKRGWGVILSDGIPVAVLLVAVLVVASVDVDVDVVFVAVADAFVTVTTGSDVIEFVRVVMIFVKYFDSYSGDAWRDAWRDAWIVHRVIFITVLRHIAAAEANLVSLLRLLVRLKHRPVRSDRIIRVSLLPATPDVAAAATYE
jgi:hypothetical protein